jgi:leader peptidase (prepilin peptidase)/N-methyltransferase
MLTGEWASLASSVVFIALLAGVVWIDARHLVIPDALNAAIFATGVGAALWTGAPSAPSAAAASVGGAAALWLVREAVSRRTGREAMGLGDIKFVAAAGVWVGLPALPAMLVIASAAGLAYAVLRRVDAGSRIPFGPFLAVGAGTARWLDSAGWLG